MTQAVSNAAFGIYLPKWTGTIFELLSAPVNFAEIVLGYVGAAATKALFIGVVILATSFAFVDLQIQHPMAMLAFLVLTCLSFSLFGFIKVCIIKSMYHHNVLIYLLRVFIILCYIRNVLNIVNCREIYGDFSACLVNWFSVFKIVPFI